MAYKRHDKDNNEVSPQPGKTTVNQFSGNEGWSTVTYENFNADYVARKDVLFENKRGEGLFSTVMIIDENAYNELEVGMTLRVKDTLPDGAHPLAGFEPNTTITALNNTGSGFFTITFSPRLCDSLDPSQYGNVPSDFIFAGAKIIASKVRTPGTFQARNADNSPRTPAAYQRHDKDNNPVTG